MALVQHLVAAGFTRRQASLIGFESVNIIAATLGQPTPIVEGANNVGISGAPNQYVSLPRVQESKTGLHYVYNSSGALPLFVSVIGADSFITGAVLYTIAAGGQKLFIGLRNIQLDTNNWGIIG